MDGAKLPSHAHLAQLAQQKLPAPSDLPDALSVANAVDDPRAAGGVSDGDLRSGLSRMAGHADHDTEYEQCE